MDMRTEFDWLQSSTEDRKFLYAVTKRLMATRDLSLDQVARAAFGQTFGRGYEDNFRAGRMSLKNCIKLHRWMRGAHPEFAAELDSALSESVSELPTLPRRAVRYIQRYIGGKYLLYYGREPEVRNIHPTEFGRALGKLFSGSDRKERALVTSAELEISSTSPAADEANSKPRARRKSIWR